jgi:ribosomal protein S18 acetylase RimI-like enzyme
VALGQRATPRPRSLVWATQIDVLPLDRVVERNGDYLLVRSPRNPRHHWGNLLLFDQPPGLGAGREWEARFEAEFGDDPRVRHRTFAWDGIDAGAGLASEEFVRRGYELEESIGLVAERRQVRAHRRENREVLIRALEAAPGADAELWEAVLELQVGNRDEFRDEQGYRVFAGARLSDLREHFRAGRGAWYVAIDPAGGEVVASCGVVVVDGRARFQAVDTARSHRRRGICSRLIVEAAHRSAVAHGAERFVIVAQAGYHAVGLYESLGFSRQETVFGVCRWRQVARASLPAESP